jgi:hypothetical protein
MRPMNFESVGHPMKALYTFSKSVTSNSMLSMQKFFQVPKVTARIIWPTGVAAALGTMRWKGAQLDAIGI